MKPETRNTRLDQLDDFLEIAGWGRAPRHPLAGDASRRRYIRLEKPDGSRAILMDAPPETGEDIRPFLRIGTHLRGLGLSAPEMFADDPESGFLLLEDLGDALFARVIPEGAADEEALYSAAVDVLAHLHREHAPADLPVYGIDTMPALAALAVDWYAPGATGGRRETAGSDALAAACRAELVRLAPETSVLALRDFHSENLLWLPDRTGIARVGLLDFQDGMAGHPAYDLVSLTKDARRDVVPALGRAMIERYIAATGQDPEAFHAAAAAQSAQRNLRILGVFARLSLHFGKPGYVDLIPRVWDHLIGDLAHPELATLRHTVQEMLPPPTPDRLGRLREEAGTWPMA